MLTSTMKQCTLCAKGSRIVGGYSNRVRATKFNPIGKSRKQPNLQWATLTTGGRVKLCTNCLKKGKHLSATAK